MKIRLILPLFLLSLSSCYSYKTSLVEYTMPSNPIPTATREGRACNDDSDEDKDFITSLFYSDIDLTVETARTNGNITEITSIDKEVGRGFFPRICVVVRGN